MKKIILIFFFNFLLADDSIYNLIHKKYYQANLSQKFDIYTDRVIQKYKSDTGYFKKLLANNGLGAQKQAKQITTDIFSLYSKDLSVFIVNLLNSQDIYKLIRKNYQEYVYKGAKVVSKIFGSRYGKKFYSIYGSDQLNVMIRDDILEQINKTRDEILSALQQHVVNGQITLGQVAVATIIGSYIMNKVMRRIKSKIAKKLLGRLVPIVGWAMLAWDLTHVNELYDEIAKETKKVFHQNENILIKNISDRFKSLDNISLKYKNSVAYLLDDFIKKVKNIKSKIDSPIVEDKILNLNNYSFMMFIDSFYYVPKSEFNYLANKFFKLNSPQEIKDFCQNMDKIDDFYSFDNVKYLEKITGIDIKQIFKFRDLLKDISPQEIKAIVEYAKAHNIKLDENQLLLFFQISLNMMQRDKFAKFAKNLDNQEYYNFMKKVYDKYLLTFYQTPTYVVEFAADKDVVTKEIILKGYSLYVDSNRQTIAYLIGVFAIIYILFLLRRWYVNRSKSTPISD